MGDRIRAGCRKDGAVAPVNSCITPPDRADPTGMQPFLRIGIALVTIALVAAGPGRTAPTGSSTPGAAAADAERPKPDTRELESDHPAPLPELRRPAKPALTELDATAVVEWTLRDHALVVTTATGDAALRPAARAALDAVATKALLQADRSPTAARTAEPRAPGEAPWIADVGDRCDAMAIVYALPRTDLLAVMGCVAPESGQRDPVTTWSVLERDPKTGTTKALATTAVEHVSSPHFGVRMGDLDGNGSPDLLADWNSGGSGLAAQFSQMTAILTDATHHRAAVAALGWAAGLDVVAVRAPGVQLLLRDFVHCDRCTDGKPHNFWTFDLVGFRDLRPVVMNDAAADLPRFEWLSFRSEDRNRALLTPAMRRELHPGWEFPKRR